MYKNNNECNENYMLYSETKYLFKKVLNMQNNVYGTT